MTSDDRPFPIVGVGASAGGIPALQGLFKGLESDGRLAFVIVTHLNPDRESLLHEIISRHTKLPVAVTEQGARVQRGHVYVMPQNAILTIANGRFEIRKPNPLQRELKPIDIFFSSLAKDQGECAVGIVLSGGDSDGTLGVEAIKEHGGLTLAQSPDGSGPSNPEMPSSAISSGLVDLALPVEEMGAVLNRFADSIDGLERGATEEDRAGGAASDAIYELLRNRTGHDFSGYKTKTFLRRVRRRMQVAQVDTVEAYIDLLRHDSTEVMHLFRDLLINVTSFFRDADAFEALNTLVIPKLLEERGADDMVRVWVPGCATGEEVYSVAMLIREHMDTLVIKPRVQVFATDIDEIALGVARAGRYPEPLLEAVSPERRQRFFVKDSASLVVSKDVREMCVFSPHNVVRDPPFSRMDLVSCRNLLIYFGPQIQQQVIPIFHYALKPGGYLFLGSSEGISQYGDLFATVDKKNRIFRGRETAGHVRHHFSMPAPISQLPQSGRARPGAAPPANFQLRQAVEAHVIDRVAPAHVVVNSEGDVVYYSGRTGRFLEQAKGAPNRQLLGMLRRGLRLDVRAALREAMDTGLPVARNDVTVDGDDDRVQSLRIVVEPLADRGQAEPLYLVLFTPLGPALTASEAREQQHHRDGAVADLEQELRDTKERLQSTIEEYETALEELKSSNEELVSVNEESQSTNEELEASREELQSLNEELNTVNAELNSKVDNLDRANSDLRNLFESTQVATVFLDRNLVIRNFTPAASTFFKLRAADVGRPLTELAGYLEYPDLKDHIKKVFETAEVIEHRIKRGGREASYLVRLIPYRDGHSQVDGVVVTFVDITSLATSEEHQKVLIAELNHRVKNMLAVMISITSQTMKQTNTKEEFGEALIGRMHAMARAYETLSRRNWMVVPIDDIVRQELEPFGIERITAKGPKIEVPPQVGLSIGMVVHELATNAAKYGALSTPQGQVLVDWWAPDEHTLLRLRWTESHGPTVHEPDHSGFGLRFIRGEIENRFSGTVKVEFEATGLTVELKLPVME